MTGRMFEIIQADEGVINELLTKCE